MLHELVRALRRSPGRGFTLLNQWVRMRRESRCHLIEKPTVPELSGGGQIAFVRPSDPLFSIVIPVFNHVAVALNCLKSIATAATSETFEVIVVDDASTDADATCLGDIPGAVYLRHSENQGFVASCNAGAAAAKGQNIVFLNSDTIVAPAWLEGIRGGLSEPGVELLGVLLQYPDGTLQEAGGIVFSDGSGWNYGRGGNPNDPRYLYRRDVDYCSGAALAILRERFVSLGGFDSRYAPGYYEDTDLAMKVRAAGGRVLYEPSVAIVHLEGVSAGRDLSSGMKAHQSANAIKFRQRWARELQIAHWRPGTDPDLAARPSPADSVVAVCGNQIDGRSPAFYDLLESLVRQGIAVDLHLLETPDESSLRQLRFSGVCCWTYEWRETARWVLLKKGHQVGVVIGDGSAAAEAWISKVAGDVPNARMFRFDAAADAEASASVVTPADVLDVLTGSTDRLRDRQ